MNGKRSSLFFLAFIFALSLRAQAPRVVFVPSQSEFRILGKSIPELRRQEKGWLLGYPVQGIRLSVWPIGSAEKASDAGREDIRSGSSRPTPVFSPKDLAFFCRIEWRLEKAARFPIRIRLGEVQYVDQMEGKY
ncbi:MAG: hypothetical protein IPH16_06610 [Haliscomenobacter sp.]|nr:hypothetical protein [Haliscomenobacter sp.]